MGRSTGKNRSGEKLSAMLPALFSATATGRLALCLATGILVFSGCSWKGLMEKRREMPPSPGAWKIYEIWPFSAKEAASRQDQTAGVLNVPKEYSLDIGDSKSIKFMLIPAGRFVMGSPVDEIEHQIRESPVHEVVITRPYYMSETEITQGQYQAICGSNPGEFKDPAKPVENVRWDDAENFCKRLSLKTGLKIDLPTEAQWEYACRAGTQSPFNTGRTITTDQANFDGNYSYDKGPKGEFRNSTTPAGNFSPNAFGLYDMHGNVWEWCSDWLDGNEYHVGDSMTIDPLGAAKGENKVLRGGCWYLNPGFARSAYRQRLAPETFNNQIGLRVVMEIPGVGAMQGHYDVQSRPAQTQSQPQIPPPSSRETPGPTASDNMQQTPPQPQPDEPVAQNPQPVAPPEKVPQADPDPVRPPTIKEPDPAEPPKKDDPVIEIAKQPDPPPVRTAPQPAAQPTRQDLVFTDWPFDKDQAAQMQTRTAETLGVEKQISLDLGSGETIKLSLIPAGRFMMGSPENEKGRRNTEGPQHQVTISRPFYMGICEVTQRQYQAIAGENPSNSKNPDNPVEKVAWTKAMAFCHKLSEKTGRTVRLPTEAQWEYACRAGSAGRFCFGDKDSSLGDYCWYLNSAGHQTHPVAQKSPNAFGLYDMHGNVWEWCSDWYDETYPTDDVTDPAGPQKGTWRVVRGGAWDAAPQDCRSAVRSKFLPDKQEESYGFRIVVDVEKGKAVAAPPVNPPPVNPPPTNPQVTKKPDDGEIHIDEWTPPAQPQTRPAPPPPPPPDAPKGFLELLNQAGSTETQPATQKAER